jgi:hypothetical protein
VSNKGVTSLGRERHLYPREFWGSSDFEDERQEMDRGGAPLPHAPGGPPPELKFSLFETPITGGARGRAVDELVARYVGRRR